MIYNLKTVYQTHVIIKKMKNKLIEKINKFFASKILGRKYTRAGKCNACGRCCKEIYVRHSSHVIKDEEEFLRLKPNHFFYSYLKVTGKTDIGLVFECTKLDKDKGICTAYKNRALICRKYPQEELLAMGGELSEGCGYELIPIKSFEDVFKEVREKSKQ